MSEIDLPFCLKALAFQRPLFHSEADFQHALAWTIQTHSPTATIRLERPFLVEQKSIYADIWIIDERKVLVLELKYKTRSLATTYADEPFILRNHSAHDLGRYDFVKDIQRLETIVTSLPDAVGYAVFLTNDGNYWLPARSPHSIDSDFRLFEGRVLQGTLQWGAQASVGTMRGREEPLTLRGSYLVRWNPYSRVGATTAGQFHCTIVRVGRTHSAGGG